MQNIHKKKISAFPPKFPHDAPYPASLWSVWAGAIIGLVLATFLIFPGYSNTYSHKEAMPEEKTQFQINLGVLHLLAGYTHEALRNFQVIKEKPWSSISMGLSGIAQKMLGQRKMAFASFREAELEADGSYTLTLLENLGEEGESLSESGWSQIIESSAPEALYLFGIGLLQAGQIQQGTSLLEASSEGGFPRHMILVALASSLLQNGRYIEAQKYAEELQKLKAKHLGSQLLASIKIGCGDFDEALLDLNHVYMSGTAKAFNLYLKGKALLGSGKIQDGETLLYKALVEQDDYIPAHLTLAQLYTDQENYASAKLNFDRILVKETRLIKALMAKAEFHVRMDEKDEAAKLWRKVLALDPSGHTARRRLGFYHLSQEEYPIALQLLEKESLQDNDNPLILRGILKAAKALDNKSKIIYALERLAVALPEDESVHHRLLEAFKNCYPLSKGAAHIRNILKQSSLDPPALLIYLEWATQARPIDAKPLVNQIGWMLVNHDSTQVNDLTKATQLLLAPRPDHIKVWSYSLLTALASKACLLSKQKDNKILSQVFAVLKESEGAAEAEKLLLQLARKYPNNQAIINLLIKMKDPKNQEGKRKKQKPSKE